jgi:hypothetical protein
MGTLTISRNNIGLRFFLWAWEADPDKLNICKLLWGTVFLPVGIFFAKESSRPFYYLSRLAASWLTCIVIPSLCLGIYDGALAVFMLVLFSIFYNYVRRDAIARKCDLQDAKNEAEKAKLETEEYRFSERTERILDKIFNPIFWLIGLVGDAFERFSWTKPGERITGFFSLCYYFIKSAKQNTCLLVKVK